MQRHAFLIIAHNNLEDLINLIQSIDYKYNDIFIHIDKKWKKIDFEKVVHSAIYSNIYFTDKRISVAWGGFSQIKVELMLIKQALGKNNYSYFHLLSGQDLCIKSQQQLHDFFEINNGKEFLCFCGKDWQVKAQDRVKYYHLTCGRSGLKLKIDKLFVKLQKLFRINRIKHSKLTFLGGSNWASITCKFAEHLIANEASIYKIFSHTFCADEIYKHTMAYNSSFHDNFYLFNTSDINDDADPNMNISNIRLIDWVRGKPYVFNEEDYKQLLFSPCMFVRKVTHKNKLPEMILDNLKNN